MYGVNSFIMLALVSRMGTVEQAGCFGIAFTTAQLLYVIGLFGVSHYQMTDYGEKYTFQDYACVRLFSCGLMALCCAGAIVLLRFDGEKLAYTVSLSVLMLLNVVGDLYQSYFFQKNRLDLSGSALFYRTLWPLLLFAGILILTRRVLLAVVVQMAANLLLTLFYAKKAAALFPYGESEPSISSAKGLISECMSLFLSLLVMNLIVNISKYGVEFLLDDAAQGYYSMIFMPAQVINLCSQFLFKPFLNQYAALLARRELTEFAALLKRQFRFILGLTAVCCAGAYWLGAPVLGILYQKDLRPFTIPLVFVVLGGGFFAACQLMYYIFVILRQQVRIFHIYLAALLPAAGLTALLVRSGQLFGAALSFLAVHVLILLCYLRRLVRILGRRSDA